MREYIFRKRVRGENIPEKSSKKGAGGGVTIGTRAAIEWEEKCVLEMMMMVLAW